MVCWFLILCDGALCGLKRFQDLDLKDLLIIRFEDIEQLCGAWA